MSLHNLNFYHCYHWQENTLQFWQLLIRLNYLLIKLCITKVFFDFSFSKFWKTSFDAYRVPQAITKVALDDNCLLISLMVKCNLYISIFQLCSKEVRLFIICQQEKHSICIVSSKVKGYVETENKTQKQ